MNRLKIIALLVLAIALGTKKLSAQSAQVSGQVLDQTQAIVSGAEVTLIRTDTGDHRQVLSNEQGYYSFPLVLPGEYSISAKKEGFNDFTRKGIVVQTGLISTIDIVLGVGAVTQTVDVEGTVPLLTTDTAAVTGVIDNNTIKNMALIDRRSAQLQRLNGFVVQTNTGNSASFVIAGGRANNANYYIDGGTAQNVMLGTPTLAFDPPVESVQEFNVAISNYEAELGRSGGGVIQVTTKSGTNEFHGSAYEYLRNTALDTRTFFSSINAPLHYNLFGASLGGPIKKDKTQFFFNYEGRRQTVNTNQLLNVPSTAELHGDFSGDPSVKPIIDPVTGRTFASENTGALAGKNIIPQNRLDPVGAALAAFYPAPNVPGAPIGKANFDANVPATTIVDDYVGRIDHVFSEKDRIFGKFIGETAHTRTGSIFPTPGTDQFGNLSHSYFYSAGVTWFHTFSPTLINQAIVTLTRRQGLNFSAGANTTLDQQIGLKGVNQNFFPTVTVNGYAQLGSNQQERLQTPVNSNQYADNITLIRGKHQFKAGVELRTAADGDLFLPFAGGNFSFNNVATGNSLASLLLGYVNQANVLATEYLDIRSITLGAYFQDDWHVTPRLTLNLGLRWDVDQPRWELHNRQNSFDPTAINPVSGTPGVVLFSGLNGASKYANNWDWHNFGPRVGIAWRVTDKWVVRGGGGLLYLGEYDQPPIQTTLGFSAQNSYVSPDGGKTPAFLLANGFPGFSFPTQAQLTPAFGAVRVGQTPTTAVSYFNRKRENGYSYQTSLTIERELGKKFLLEIGYLGTFSHHLAAPDPLFINQVPTSKLGPGNLQSLRPFPQFSNVSIIAPDIGISNYNGVNVGLKKQYSRGLTFQANYTYSKMLDNVDSRNEIANFPTENGAVTTGAFANLYNQKANYGLSGSDIRHRFIVSSTYELPFGKGKLLHTDSNALNHVIGGWTLGVINELHTGSPLEAVELTNLTNSFSENNRPNVVGNPNQVPGGRNLHEWFNTAAFSAPAPFTFGNSGRTFGSGPGFIGLDASLLKDLQISERVVTQFRVEALNLLNHPNFANPDTREGSPTFGQITSLALGNQSRILQLGLHVKF